jgi:hypothetical protein
VARGRPREVALAAGLGEETHGSDHDVMRQRLAHVVDRERGRRGADQRFHFDAGLVVHGDAAEDAQFARRAAADLDLATFERERMAERNQLVGTLRGHDTRDDGGVEHGALLRAMPRGLQRARRGRW